MRYKDIINEHDDDEDAYIDHRRLTKRGYSSSAASQITGYVPPARSYPRRPSTPVRPVQSSPSIENGRQYLNVSYNDKDAAKAAALSIQKRLGWDPEKFNPVTHKKGCWYVDASTGPVTDAVLGKWLIKS